MVFGSLFSKQTEQLREEIERLEIEDWRCWLRLAESLDDDESRATNRLG